ncbi:MAG: class I SAM-dependent methyltransferase [Sedimentisphaerales bacterium]|nr:class I SAM-dependent methyltransferase [Sedimentisphaerales bacterium]
MKSEPDILSRPPRNRRQRVADFLLFPLRALLLLERDRWGLSSLATERYGYVGRLVQGRCLDVGCGPGNRFIRETLAAPGQGIDVYPYEGLTAEQLVEDIRHFPCPDESFDSVTFIANMNHVPEPLRDRELSEAYRCLRPGGNIIVTMGNPLAEILVHKLVEFYDKVFDTHLDRDGQRGMQDQEQYYLRDAEIRQRLIRAGFGRIRKHYFATQWCLNHLFVAWKP